jgi:hypothetical protein
MYFILLAILVMSHGATPGYNLTLICHFERYLRWKSLSIQLVAAFRCYQDHLLQLWHIEWWPVATIFISLLCEIHLLKDSVMSWLSCEYQAIQSVDVPFSVWKRNGDCFLNLKGVWAVCDLFIPKFPICIISI